MAVGDAIIDLTPGSAVRTGIDTVGRADKPLLIAAIVVASLLLGALITAPPRRTVRGIVVGFAALGAVAVWASARETQRDLAAVVAVQVLAVGAASAVAVGLRRLALPGAPRTSAHGADAEPVTVASPLDPPATRRAFMAYAGAGAAFATIAALGGQKLRARSSASSARAAVALPAPVSLPASPGPDGTFDAVPGISRFVTPNADFYRIDTALLVPAGDAGPTGSCRSPASSTASSRLRLDDLLAMPLVEEHVTLSCVSNEVGGDLVGNASWRGVPLLSLLERAGVRPEATQVSASPSTASPRASRPPCWTGVPRWWRSG